MWRVTLRGVVALWAGLVACGQNVSDHSGVSGVSGAGLDKMAAPMAIDSSHPSPKEYRLLQHRPDRLMVELPNRLIVLVQELHAAPVVSAGVWVKTGSIYEQEHVGAGLSHFLEHLLSGGTTTTRTEAQSNAILGAIGAETNAATSLDTVRYYINTSSAYADQAIDLLSDWMRHSRILPQEYERERSVIQREFEMGRGEPGRIMWKLTQQARYAVHPARHPTIGYLDEFLKITRDEIYDFYKRMYVPNNMVFVVVGDIDKQRVVDQIVGLWKDAKPADLPELSFPKEGRTPHQHELSGTADIDKPSLRLAWPGTRLAAPGDYALDLLTSVLGQGESSRLIRTVRDQQRLVNTISAYNISFPWGEGFVGVDAEIAVPPVPADAQATPVQWRDQHLQKARDAILEQIEHVRRDGVTDQELARAKRKTMARAVYSAQTVKGMAFRLAGDLIGMKDPDYLRHYVQAIESITRGQIQQAAADFLDRSAMISITLLPMPEGQKPVPLVRPADPPVKQSVEREPVVLDNREILKQSFLVEEASEDEAVAIEIDPMQRYVMPNGLRLLVGRSTVVPAVAMQMYHLGGLLADPPGQEGLVNASATMRIKGTTTRTAGQIARQVEDLGASLSTHSGYNTSYSKAVCLKEDWETVLGLLGDVTMNPTFPDDEWDKLQPRLLAAIDRQTDTWNGELRQYFRRAYFGDFPWAWSPVGRREAVEQFTTDDLRKIHRGRLGASQSVLVVVGDIDPQRVVDRVRELFASMPTKPKAPFNLPDPVSPSGGLIQHQTSKPLAAVQIGFGPGVARKSPDYPGLSVLARVLNRFPSGWLEQELRGRGPGLVYAVGAGQLTGLVPGYFAVVFNTQPDAVSEALGRAMAVARRARDTRVGGADLAAAKAKVFTDEFLYKQTHSQRAADAALNELYGLGLDEPEALRRRVEQLDAAQLQVIARKYLRNPVAVVMSHQPIDKSRLRSYVEDFGRMVPAGEDVQGDTRP